MEKLGIKRMNLQATKESMAELKLLTHVLYTDTDFVRTLIYVHCQHLFICLGPLSQTKNHHELIVQVYEDRICQLFDCLCLFVLFFNTNGFKE
jgi:hypothetical protein